MKNVLFCFGLFLLVGCTSSGIQIPAADSPGAQVFLAHCGTCHAYPHPARNTAKQWQHIVALMEIRMRERGMSPLGRTEHTALLAYLKANSRQ